ncbi:hypothetical protein GCM10018962_90800 [Dactylosporangium matsuzakiense]
MGPGDVLEQEQAAGRPLDPRARAPPQLRAGLRVDGDDVERFAGAVAAVLRAQHRHPTRDRGQPLVGGAARPRPQQPPLSGAGLDDVGLRPRDVHPPVGELDARRPPRQAEQRPRPLTRGRDEQPCLDEQHHHKRHRPAPPPRLPARSRTRHRRPRHAHIPKLDHHLTPAPARNPRITTAPERNRRALNAPARSTRITTPPGRERGACDSPARGPESPPRLDATAEPSTRPG